MKILEVRRRAISSGLAVGFTIGLGVMTMAQHNADGPVQVTQLSQREIIEKDGNGALDILIGTHRMASPDVQFQNLGLLIIDEEQRFGVEVKARLKAIRSTVDVLTMTASIPASNSSV